MRRSIGPVQSVGGGVLQLACVVANGRCWLGAVTAVLDVVAIAGRSCLAASPVQQRECAWCAGWICTTCALVIEGPVLTGGRWTEFRGLHCHRR